MKMHSPYKGTAPVTPPSTGFMDIDTSVVSAITDCWGLAAVDCSVNNAKATNAPWKASVSLLSGLFVEPVTGSTSQWAMFKTPSDGYNIQVSEVTARGQNIATVLGGVGNKTYGYGFFEDAVAYIAALTPAPSITISFDLIRPVLLGSYTTTQNEITYALGACTTAGVTVRCVQLCYELGLKDNQDVFPNAAAIVTATQTVATYIGLNFPGVDISIDANLWDDLTQFHPTLNTLLNGVTGVQYVRQYLQFKAYSYNDCRTRITQLPAMIAYFTSTFTHGQKMRLAQSEVKTTTSVRLKVGDGLLFAELCINIIKQNILNSDIIKDFVFFNLERLVSNSNFLYSAYHMAVLMRSAMNNNGMGAVTFTNAPSAAPLVTLPVKRGTTGEVYLLNPTANVINIPAVRLNGVVKNVNVFGYYGDPMAATDSIYSANNVASVSCQAYSLIKVNTL